MKVEKKLRNDGKLILDVEEPFGSASFAGYKVPKRKSRAVVEHYECGFKRPTTELESLMKFLGGKGKNEQVDESGISVSDEL